MDQPTPESITLPPREFSGKEADQINLATAALLTRQDRHDNPKQPHGYFFGREIIEQILAQPGCMGVRIYFGVVPRTPLPPRPAPVGGWRVGQRHLLMVGADKYKNDQLVFPAYPTEQMPMDTEDLDLVAAQDEESYSEEEASAFRTVGIIAEMAIPCPNQCGAPNPLNS